MCTALGLNVDIDSQEAMNVGLSSLKVVGLILWIAAAATGITYSIYYENRPGEAYPAPVDWPAASSLHRATEAYTLLVFLHPGCGCSNATYRELEKILARPHAKLQTHAIVASYPKDEDSDLMRSVIANTEINVVRDSSGSEQQLFAAKTSGLTLLYDPSGKLVFQGGITSRRGHVGENKGSESVREILSGKQAESSHTFVFGCGL